MKIKLILQKSAILSMVLMCFATLLYADETQPKFTIIPTTQTKWVIPSNGNALVTYVVTNQTKITRTLTMKPISGITQQTTGVGVCGSTFTLAHGQSCQLVLPLTGSQLSGHITEGPVICKTKGNGNNSPDPYLCSQPSRANTLDITSVGAESASITVTPNALAMIVGPLGLPPSSTLTVTNHSQTVTALNITAHLPGAWASVGNVSNCISVAPGGTCEITLTQGHHTLGPENIPVYGSNTTVVNVLLAVIKGVATISSSPVSLVLVDNVLPQNVTVTNNSSIGAVAHNVHAHPPNAFVDAHVTVNAAACTTLIPGASCNITFTPPAAGDAVVPSGGGYLPVSIFGDNTTDAPVDLRLEFTDASISVTPTSMHFAQEDPSVQSFTVTNITSPSNPVVSALNILATTTANFNASALNTQGKVQLLPSTTCTNSLNKGISCTFNFSAISGGGSIGATTFNIAGANTNAIPVTISVSNQKLSWSNPALLSNTSIVLATQNIFTKTSGAGTSGTSTGIVPSKNRTLTVYNIGTSTADNVIYTVTLPSGTTITPTSCGHILPSQSCTLTIKQGSTPSTAGPNSPHPSVITVAGDHTNTIKADITLLTYGNLYGGKTNQDGYVYWINDDPPASSSVTGRVVAKTDGIDNYIKWDSSANCNENGGCVNVPNTSNNDGKRNTSNIRSAIGTQTTSYAAQFCYESSSSHDWYLPAECELSYDSISPSADCGKVSQPAYQNIVSNANLIHYQAFNHWSSTQSAIQSGLGCPTPSQCAWSNGIGPLFVQNKLYPKWQLSYVRCAKEFP